MAIAGEDKKEHRNEEGRDEDTRGKGGQEAFNLCSVALVCGAIVSVSRQKRREKSARRQKAEKSSYPVEMLRY